MSNTSSVSITTRLLRPIVATNLLGLRLDARATSLETGHVTRMGSSLRHRLGGVRFDLDLARGTVVPPAGFQDDGADWSGRRLNLQVLRPSAGQLPEIVDNYEVVVPTTDSRPRPGRGARSRPALITVDSFVDAGSGDWVILRISDPAQPAPGIAAGTSYAGLGKAIAYASPFYLDTAAV